MSLSNDRKKELRGLGHTLKPVVTVAGKGLSESVMEELDRALKDHELIKIKVVVGDRDMKQQVIEEICQKHKAELVNVIGNKALILRKNNQPNKKLSNLIY